MLLSRYTGLFSQCALLGNLAERVVHDQRKDQLDHVGHNRGPRHVGQEALQEHTDVGRREGGAGHPTPAHEPERNGRQNAAKDNERDEEDRVQNNRSTEQNRLVYAEQRRNEGDAADLALSLRLGEHEPDNNAQVTPKPVKPPNADMGPGVKMWVATPPP